jgi:hypothetical protein
MIMTAPTSNKRLSYDEALLYCQFCNYKGYTDWCMPTDNEYRMIMNDGERLIGWTRNDDGYFNDIMIRYVTPIRIV